MATARDRRRSEAVGGQALFHLGPHGAARVNQLVAAAGHAAAEDQVVEAVGERALHAADLSAAARRAALDCRTLDFPSLLIRFALALWVGGTLLVVVAAPVVFGEIPSRDRAGAVFGEILRRFEIVKQVLSLALVIGVFVNLERGGGLAGRSVAARRCDLPRHCDQRLPRDGAASADEVLPR